MYKRQLDGVVGDAPMAELAIARRFAALPAYHRAFVSCNRAFLLDRDRRLSLIHI